MTALHDRVAERCARSDIPLTAAGVEVVERLLREERRAEAYGKLNSAVDGIVIGTNCFIGVRQTAFITDAKGERR